MPLERERVTRARPLLLPVQMLKLGMVLVIAARFQVLEG
jgi:hypothetical protein